jgi:hypothetical protein
LAPEDTQPASDADDAASGDVAAHMEQVIDRFIWHDGDREDRTGTIASAPIHDAPDGRDEMDIVAKLAPRRSDGPEWLPRIVTSSLPIRPPVLQGDDRWDLEFVGASHEADDGATTAPASPPPPALHVPPARSRPLSPEPAPKYHQPRVLDEPLAFAAGWPKAPRVLAAAAAMTCMFSTGVIWATHRSEMVADSGAQPIEIAAMTPQAIVDGDRPPGRPIRNTPVLVREGETRAIVSALAAAEARQGPSPTRSPMVPASVAAPDLPRVFNGGEFAHSVPVAQVMPIAPVVRRVPIVPIVLSGPAAVDVPSPLPPPALDRDRLADLAARPAPADASASAPTPATGAEPPPRKAKTDARPKHREPARLRGHAKRVSPPPVQSRGAAPKVARGHVPAVAWEMRQGLRTDPEPQPSTLKKLIGYVWPFGKSSTAAAPAEPAKPAAPAVTARPYSWSDDARARP